MLKTIIFDLDGTLFDTRKDIAEAVNHARSYFGLCGLSLERVTEMVGHGISVLAEKAFEDSEVNPVEARGIILGYYLENPSRHARLYPGVRETLPLLGVTRTVVSNKPKQLVDALLEDHGIAAYFDFVAGGDTFEQKKPDPAAVLFILNRYGLTADNLLIVGDHSPDIEMGHRAGVRTVYCNYGFFGADTIGADFFIDSFRELVELVRTLKE